MAGPDDILQPLSEAEFKELDDFLLSDAAPDDVLSLSEIDGLLTAVVCGPNAIVPSQWLPAVWGGGQPVWSTQQQAERVHTLLLRHLNGIVDGLVSAPPHFQPVVWTRPGPQGDLEIVDDWCLGFLDGVKLDARAWQEIEQHDAGAFFGAIRALSRAATPVQDELFAKLGKGGRNPSQLIADAVVAIHRFWLARRRPPAPRAPAPSLLPAARSKTGRNDPCPCGSGKKYKKCCGAAGAGRN